MQSQSVGRVCHYGIYHPAGIEKYTGLRFVMASLARSGRAVIYRWHPAHFGYLGSNSAGDGYCHVRLSRYSLFEF